MGVFKIGRQRKVFFRGLAATLSLVFVGQTILPAAQASVLSLPVPGAMVPMTPAYMPTIIRGLTIHPDNALAFDFIVDKGQEDLQGEVFKEESRKLINYFLAALTVPKEEMWVNLSPYEPERIIPVGFGDTKMGRDMLAQDYLLKQLSASMMYPEKGLGQKFWQRVYTRAQKEYGTTDIPMNTFKKIWIIPENVAVYEKDASVFVVDSHLKVMLEEDHLGYQQDLGANGRSSGLDSNVIREVLIPEIEKEVNEGKIFANLRQIYNSIILATWYKDNLKESLLGQVYVDQSKTLGVDTDDKSINQKIYHQYIEAFEKGVYDYIKEDVDPITQTAIPRKYFSGGSSAIAMTIKKVLSPVTKMMRRVIDAGNRIVRLEASLVGISQGALPEVERYVQQVEMAASSILKMDPVKRSVLNLLDGKRYPRNKIIGVMARVSEMAQNGREIWPQTFLEDFFRDLGLKVDVKDAGAQLTSGEMLDWLKKVLTYRDDEKIKMAFVKVAKAQFGKSVAEQTKMVNYAGVVLLVALVLGGSLMQGAVDEILQSRMESAGYSQAQAAALVKTIRYEKANPPLDYTKHSFLNMINLIEAQQSAGKKALSSEDLLQLAQMYHSQDVIKFLTYLFNHYDSLTHKDIEHVMYIFSDTWHSDVVETVVRLEETEGERMGIAIFLEEMRALMETVLADKSIQRRFARNTQIRPMLEYVEENINKETSLEGFRKIFAGARNNKLLSSSVPVEKPQQMQGSASFVATDAAVGGIDFNIDQIKWQINRDGNGVPLPVALQPIESMQIDGFLPMIMSIVPVSLPMLLGFSRIEWDAAVAQAADNNLVSDSDAPASYAIQARVVKALERVSL